MLQLEENTESVDLISPPSAVTATSTTSWSGTQSQHDSHVPTKSKANIHRHSKSQGLVLLNESSTLQRAQSVQSVDSKELEFALSTATPNQNSFILDSDGSGQLQPKTPPRTYSLHFERQHGNLTSDSYEGITDENDSPKDSENFSSPSPQVESMPMPSSMPQVRQERYPYRLSIDKHNSALVGDKISSQYNQWPSNDPQYHRRRTTDTLDTTQVAPRLHSTAISNNEEISGESSSYVGEKDEYTLPWPYVSLFEPLQASRFLFWNVFSAWRLLLFLFLSCGLVLFMTAFYVWPLWNTERYNNNIPLGIVNTDMGFDVSQLNSSVPGFTLSLQRTRKILDNKTLGEWVLSSLTESISLDKSWKYQWSVQASSNASASDDESKKNAIAAIDRADYWGIIYIPSNFSITFIQQVILGSTMNSSSQEVMIEFIYDEARQWNVAKRLWYRMQTQIRQDICQSLAERVLNEAMEGDTTNSFVKLPLIRSPRLLLQPISIRPIKIHDSKQSGQYSSNYRILLILWIGSLFSVVYLVRTYGYWMRQMVLTTTHHKLTVPSKIMISVGFSGLIISLIQGSLLFAALYLLSGPDLFFFAEGVWIWLYLWLVSYTFFAIHIWVSTFIGPEYIWLLSIPLLMFQVATSSSFFDQEQALPTIVIWANHAFPFTWALRGFTCLSLGSGCRSFPLDVSIIGAWCLVALILAYLVGIFLLRRFRRQLKSSEEAVVFGRRRLSTTFM